MLGPMNSSAYDFSVVTPRPNSIDACPTTRVVAHEETSRSTELGVAFAARCGVVSPWHGIATFPLKAAPACDPRGVRFGALFVADGIRQREKSLRRRRVPACRAAAGTTALRT
jgi:hypothetical protein